MTAPDGAAADIEVLASEEAFFAGLLAGDATALEQVLAEDCAVVTRRWQVLRPGFAGSGPADPRRQRGGLYCDRPAGRS